MKEGAGPAAIGGILGSVVALARGLSELWQFVVLAVSVVGLLVFRRGAVPVLLVAALVGLIVVRVGASLRL